jgi:TonB family protein
MGFRGQYGLMVALAITPAGAWAKNKSAPAHPIGNPGRYFGPDAYPPAAIRAEEQGRVVATVDIAANGAATACKATVSSGSTALDARTCEIAMTSIKYVAALDAHGRNVAGTYTLPVRWVMPRDDSPGTDGGQTTVSFSGSPNAPVCSVVVGEVTRHIVQDKCRALVGAILAHGGTMSQPVSIALPEDPYFLLPLGE